MGEGKPRPHDRPSAEKGGARGTGAGVVLGRAKARPPSSPALEGGYGETPEGAGTSYGGTMEPTEKRCPKCGNTLPVESFGRNKARHDGLQSYCKPCQKEAIAAYNRSEKGKQRNREYSRRDYVLDYHREYRKKNCHKWPSEKGKYVPPDKQKARNSVNAAIRRGVMVRPERCEGCGDEGFTEAHHHRGYSEEHKRDVVWLCSSCHGKEHRSYA